MKELKAFIRTIGVESVVPALCQAGAPGFTISRVEDVVKVRTRQRGAMALGS